MRNFLESQLGKEVDIHCQGVALSGKVIRVEGNTLHLEKDDVISYVNIEQIAVVWESREKKVQAAGFLPKPK